MRRKIAAFFMSFMFIIASIPLVKTADIHAAATTPLNEVTALTGGSLSATLAVNGVPLDNNSTVHYGDTIVCTLRWALPNNEVFKLNPGDSLTYELPDKMDFETKSGQIMNGDEALGTYTISGHTITLTYTDPDFCAQENRIGNLSFYGSIESDPNPAVNPDPIKISFTGARNFDLLVEEKPISEKLTVDKVFHVIDNPNHIYSCVIPITATGDQTNLKITDTMWPGMSLANEPKVYTTNPPSDATLFTDCSKFKDDGGDGQTFTGTIYHIEDGQTLYLYYEVKVIDDMYDEDAAKKFVEDNHYNTPGNYYEFGFRGTIPNRVNVTSDQVTTPVQRTTDIYGAGYRMEKWRADFETDKATGLNELDLGYVRWQIYINPITDQNVTTGYIIDKLPENSTLDKSSIIMHDSHWRAMNISDYVSYTTYTKDGKNYIRFDYTPKMIADLKVSTESFYIEYRTHMDKQTSEKFEYRNTATLYYNEKELDDRVAVWINTKPSELEKHVLYDAARAPYADYIIIVNPQAMDLDPDSDDLLLSDAMGSALDIDLDSITINGQAAPSGAVNIASGSRTFTIKLKDSTRYTIKYRARVNLVKDSDLNESNANNVCQLVGVVTHGNDNSAVIKGKVYESAASSSSNIGYATLNIIKHDSVDTGKLLSGATFKVSAATLSGQTVTGTTSIGSGSTNSSGKATFTSLVRGTIYLCVETDAPSGYELDETPFFVVFAEKSTSTYPSTVTYNGTSYRVNVIDFSQYSADQYVENVLETVPTNSTTPSAPTVPSDPTTSSDSSTPSNPSTPSQPSDTSNPTTPSTNPSAPSEPTEPSTTPSEPTTTTTAAPQESGTTSSETTAAPSETSAAPSETTSVPSEDPSVPSETKGVVNEATRAKESSEEPTTTTTTKATTNGIVKTGETMSVLVFIGSGFIAVSFLAVLFLAKKDKETEE